MIVTNDKNVKIKARTSGDRLIQVIIFRVLRKKPITNTKNRRYASDNFGKKEKLYNPITIENAESIEAKLFLPSTCCMRVPL